MRKRIWRGVRDLGLLLIAVVGITFWQTRGLVTSGDFAPPLSGKILGTNSNFELQTSHGKTRLLYFFAPWCGVCKVSASNLEWLKSATNDDKVQIAAIALDYESVASVEDFVRNTELKNIPVVLADDSIRVAYRISAYPSYYVIDELGRVATTSVGYSTFLGMLLRTWFA